MSTKIEKTNLDKIPELSKKRKAEYGIDGEYPVEFFPAYQRLCPSGSRFCYQKEDTYAPAKRISMFGNNFVRLEGLPVGKDPFGLLEEVLSTGEVAKIRLTGKEAEAFDKRYPEVKWTKEADTANFTITLERRVQEMERSRWRSQHGINKSRRLDVTAGVIESRDALDLKKLFDGWVSFKKQHEKLMYAKLYSGILSTTHSPEAAKNLGLMTTVLKFSGKVVGATTYLISNTNGHLLMNLSAYRTEGLEETPKEYESLSKKIGYLLYYHAMRGMHEAGVLTAQLGWCGAGDPLMKFKTDMSHEVNRLYVTDALPHFRKEQKKKKGLLGDH